MSREPRFQTWRPSNRWTAYCLGFQAGGVAILLVMAYLNRGCS